MATITSQDLEVLLPTSPEEAVEAFGDGTGVTVFAGGTILMPELAAGRLRPRRALLLARAGLDELRREGRGYVIGAMVPISRIIDEGPEPLATIAGYIADHEVRAQATLGGNVCAPPGIESPRGDLQAPLIALGAQVRSVGAGGERVESVEEFLAGGSEGRLLLEVEIEEPKRAAAAALGRPHTHAYTVLCVACAETADGVQVAVAGAGPRAVRCSGVERALAEGQSSQAAAGRALDDVTPQDDALASAWYRRKMLPVLVERALDKL